MRCECRWSQLSSLNPVITCLVFAQIHQLTGALRGAADKIIADFLRGILFLKIHRFPEVASKGRCVLQSVIYLKCRGVVASTSINCQFRCNTLSHGVHVTGTIFDDLCSVTSAGFKSRASGRRY